MNEFFEPPPPPPPPDPLEVRQPPWFGPPHGTLPGVVALELVLARTEHVAVCITRVAAYPSGFAFEVLTMAARAGGEEELLDPLLFGHHRHRMRAGQVGLPPEMLRMGVQFADGGKATNTNTSRLDPRDPGEPPSGPVMHQGGGGGGGGSWHQSQWVWPLPPPGPLAFVCEWPAAGIALTRHEVDAQPILDAAARATVIFAEEESPGGPRWTSYGAPPQVVVRKTPE